MPSTDNWGVVARDADLARHVERDFLQQMLVGHTVDKRNDQIEAGREHGVKLPEAFDYPGILLRHHAHALGDDDGDDDEKNQCDDVHIAYP